MLIPHVFRSKRLVGRHPFPGPGLAIRVLGEVTEAQLKIVRHADSIFIEEIVSAGLYNGISQAFAALLPVKAVGVAGDKRVYSQIVSNPFRACAFLNTRYLQFLDIP